MTEALKENITVLDKVLPVVVRVHGDAHPELTDIFAQYKVLKEELEGEKDAKESILKIRALTDNYTLPAGACEAYTKVYRAFRAIDTI